MKKTAERKVRRAIRWWARRRRLAATWRAVVSIPRITLLQEDWVELDRQVLTSMRRSLARYDMDRLGGI